MKKKLLCLSVAVALASCGSDGNDHYYGKSTETGVFLDSAVAGIGYRTETKSGFTNALGEYKYLPGETVTFFIGDLEFPPVPAKGVVTPEDMDPDSGDLLVDILQLLQSLDLDGNPDNGILIDPEAATIFVGDGLPVFGSAGFDAAAAELLGDVGDGLALVDGSDAQEHFSASLRAQLYGSWVLSEGAGERNVLTFIDDSRYVVIHEHTNDEQEAGSAEYGTYTWDPLTNAFEATVVYQSDDDGGLQDLTYIDVDADLLYMAEDLIVETAERVTSRSTARVGAWIMTNPEDENDITVLTLLSATDYAMVHTKNTEAYGEDEPQALAGEFGKYTLSGSNFRVTSASVDTDGPGGAYNAAEPEDQLNEEMTVNPWGSLVITDDNEGEFSFLRLGQFVVDLVDNPDGNDVIGSDVYAALESVVVLRDLSGFDAGALEDRDWRMNVRFAEEFREDCYIDFTDDTCGSAFEVSLGLDGEAWVTEIYEHIESNEAQWSGEWSVNGAGEIEVKFNPVPEFEGEDWTMTIARVEGSPTQLKEEPPMIPERPVAAISFSEPAEYGVLMSLKGEWTEDGKTYVEDSLWLTTLKEESAR